MDIILIEQRERRSEFDYQPWWWTILLAKGPKVQSRHGHSSKKDVKAAALRWLRKYRNYNIEYKIIISDKPSESPSKT